MSIEKKQLPPPLLPTPKTWHAQFCDEKSCMRLAATIKPIIQQIRSFDRQIVLLCIGTDRSTGDALGPLVGSAIIRKSLPIDVHVFGTLDQPVHAVNLPHIRQLLNNKYPRAFVMALDASLGNVDNIGVISAGYGSINPGSGVNKQLSPVGDFFITATVNVGGYMEYTILQNTRLSLVIKIADRIAEILEMAMMK